MRILYVVNPTSGKADTEDVIRLLKEHARIKEITIRFHVTSGKEDERALKNAILDFGPHRVAACGGDGTVQMVARNLMGMGVPMGILPLGSANGLATALGVPRQPLEAAELLSSDARMIPLDVLRVNEDHICIHLCDLGTNALLIKNYEQSGDKGMLGYARHLISSIRESDLMRFEVSTPEGTFVKKGYMLLVANANKYGTGVQISKGSVSDGRFEIRNIQNIDLESAIKAGLTAINILIDREMFSDVISAKEAIIRVSPRAHLQVDGEYIGEVSDLRVRIITSALKIIVPHGKK